MANLRQKLKMLANEKKGSIKERDFFRSAELKKYLDITAKAITGKNIAISVRTSSAGETACTSGDNVQINWQCSLIQYFTKMETRFASFLGMFYHELAHIRYLNFDESLKAMYAINEGKLYGDEPEDLTEQQEENLSEIENALTTRNGRIVLQNVFHNLENIADDPHDEDALIDEFGPKIEEAICKTRLSMYTTIPTMEEVVTACEKGRISKLSAMFSLILCLLRFDTVNALSDDSIETTEFGKTLKACKAHAQKARWTDSMYVRYSELTYVVIELWPYIKDEIAKCKDSSSSSGDPSKDGESSGIPDIGDLSSEEIEKILKEMSDSAESACKTSTPAGKTSAEAKKREKEGRKADREEKKEAKFSGGKKESKAGEEKTENRSEGSSTSEGEKSSEATSDTGSTSSESAEGDSRDDTSYETSTEGSAGGETSEDGFGDGDSPYGDIPHHPEGSEDESTSDCLSDILDGIMEDMAEKTASTELDREAGAAMEKEVHEVLEGAAIHKGYPLEVNRITAVDDYDVDVYNSIIDSVKSSSKRLQRKILNLMRDTQEGDTRKHRLYGKMICAEDSFRPDGRFFADKKLPLDLPNMALTVLVDESGSMYGRRISEARRAAILLYDFAVGVGIPVCVAGHTADGRNVQYNVYTDFDQYTDKDKYRLAHIAAHSENRDGAAIIAACIHMLKRPETVKMLIVISDGQPLHGGTDYRGEKGRADVTAVVKQYRRKGIEIYAAAIGDDKPAINSMYGDGFIDISDLDKLPKVLCDLVKKRLMREIY